MAPSGSGPAVPGSRYVLVQVRVKGQVGDGSERTAGNVLSPIFSSRLENASVPLAVPSTSSARGSWNCVEVSTVEAKATTGLGGLPDAIASATAASRTAAVSLALAAAAACRAMMAVQSPPVVALAVVQLLPVSHAVAWTAAVVSDWQSAVSR